MVVVVGAGVGVCVDGSVAVLMLQKNPPNGLTTSTSCNFFKSQLAVLARNDGN